MSQSNQNNIQKLLQQRSKNVYNQTDHLLKSFPTRIYWFLFILSLIGMYICAKLYFSWSGIVIFTLIAFLSLLRINFIYALLFFFSSLYYFYFIFLQKKKIEGDIIPITNIVERSKPMNTSKESDTIESSKIPQNTEGTSFTYTFWMYVNQINIFGEDNKNEDYENTWLNYRYGDWKSVFYRGNDLQESMKLSKQYQFPGVWLAPKLNNLHIVFQNDDVSKNIESIVLEDVAFNKWFQVTIVLEGTSVGVYRDGKLEKTLVLSENVPTDLNQKNIFICKDSKFNFMVQQSNYSSSYSCPEGCELSGGSGDDSGGNKSGYAGFLGEMVYLPYALTEEEISRNYEYYKKIVDKYQKEVTKDIKVVIPPLIKK